MKNLATLLIFVFVNIICAQNMDLVDVTSEIVNPKKYKAARTFEKMAIDGLASEKSWSTVPFSEDFIDIEGIKKPKFETRFKMLWDEKFLYIFAVLEEPHIWGNLKQRDTVIFYNNDFEVFISPSGKTQNYAEIEVNALNTVWDLLLDKPYRDGGKANNQWNLDNLKSAVSYNGTINNATDIDKSWNVEMAIPLDALMDLKDKPRNLPKEGELWRINFSRVQWDYNVKNEKYYKARKKDGTLKPEYNWVWSNQKVINMHEPEKWGILQFTENTSSQNVVFSENKMILFQQVAYALFRKTKFGSLQDLLKKDLGYKQEFNIVYSEEKNLKATYNKTNFGFEYVLKIPKTDSIIMINESGYLKIMQ